MTSQAVQVMLMTLYMSPCLHPLIIIVILKDVRKNINFRFAKFRFANFRFANFRFGKTNLNFHTYVLRNPMKRMRSVLVYVFTYIMKKNLNSSVVLVAKTKNRLRLFVFNIGALRNYLGEYSIHAKLSLQNYNYYAFICKFICTNLQMKVTL